MSEKKVGWLALVGAVLLFLALIGLIIVFRKTRIMVLPTRRKWEIHTQISELPDRSETRFSAFS